MRYFLPLLLAASPALACDWKVTESVDPMTDQRKCMIVSPSAHLGVGVQGDVVTFITSSAYGFRHDGLQLRVDDNPAILLGRHKRTDAYESRARDALAQIRQGQRLRVSYLDLPSSVSGDAAICELPSLIDACLSP